MMRSRTWNCPGRIWWGANLKGGPGSLRSWAHYLRDLPEYCVDTTPLVFAEDDQYNNKFSKWSSKTPTHGNGLYEWAPQPRGRRLEGWRDQGGWPHP